MPLSFKDVYELYRNNADTLGDVSLQEFSQVANYATGSQEYAAGDVGGVKGGLKKANYWINDTLDTKFVPSPNGALSVPDITGAFGSGAFELLGQNAETGREVGEAIPRGIANFVPLFAAGTIGAVPGVIGAGALSALDAFGTGGSKGEIAAAAVGPALGIGAAGVARKIATPLLGRVGLAGAESIAGTATAQEALAKGIAEGAPVMREVINSLPSRAALYLVDNVAAAGGFEAVSVALAGKPLADVFTTENLAANIVGSVPFALYDLPKLTRPQTISVTPVVNEQPGIAKISPDNELWGARVADYGQKLAGVKKIKDKVERVYARKRLNEEFEDILHDPSFTITSDKTKGEVQAKAQQAQPSEFESYVKTKLDELTARVAELTEAENLEDIVSDVNALTSEPISVAQTKDMVEAAIDTGDTLAEAQRAVATVAVEHAKRKPVSQDAVKKRIEGGAKGGRPPGVTKQWQERSAEMAADKSPEGLLALRKYEEALKQPESSSTAYLPDSLKIPLGEKLVNSIAAWKKWVQKPENAALDMDAKEKKLNSYIFRARSQAVKEKYTGSKDLSADGVTQTFHATKAEAIARADELNLQRSSDDKNKWVPRKDGKRYVLKERQFIDQNTALDEAVTSAPVNETNVLFNELFERLTKGNIEGLQDPGGALTDALARVKAKEIKSPDELQKFLGERSDQVAIAENPPVSSVPDVKILEKLPDSVVPIPEPIQVAESPAPRPSVEAAKKKLAELLEAQKKKVEAQLPKPQKDVDHARAEVRVIEDWGEWLDAQGAGDVTRAFAQTPALVAEARKVFDSSPTFSQLRTFLTSRLKSNPELVKDFLANLKNTGDLRANKGAHYRPLMGGHSAKSPGPEIREQLRTGFFKARDMAKGAETYLDLTPQERTTIWQQTGWMLGADARWRFEIDDSLSSLYHEKDVPQLRTQIKRGTELGHMLQHPTLFKFYPTLRNLRIGFDPSLESMQFRTGVDGKKEIVFGPYALEHFDASLMHESFLHEVQHAIQDIEGFSSGSNWESTVGAKGFVELVTQYEQMGLGEKAKGAAAYELYMRNFGEVEARDVAERMRLSAGERKLRPPYSFESRSPEKWIVESDEGTHMAVGTPKDGPFHYRLDDVASHTLREVGWTQDQVDSVALPFLQKLQRILPLQGVKFGRLVNDHPSGGPEILGLAKVSGSVRRLYLAASKLGAKRGLKEQAVGFGFNLAHEVGHQIEQAAMAGKLSPEAQRARENFRSWAVTNRSEWTSMLKEFAEVLPKDWRKLSELNEMFSPTNVEEFEATTHAIWSMAEAAKRGDLSLYATLTPEPVRTWWRTLAKWGRDLVGSVKSALFKAPTEAHASNREAVDKITSYYESIKHSVNDAYDSMAEFSNLAGFDSSSMSILRTSDLELIQPSLLATPEGWLRPNITGVVPKSMVDKVFDKVRNSVVYLEQLAEAYPKVANLAYAVINTPRNQKAFVSAAKEPIMGKLDLNTGKLIHDPARIPLLKMVASPGRVNNLASEIQRWENDNKIPFTLATPAKSSPKLAAQWSALLPQERAAIQLWHNGKRLSQNVVIDAIITSKEQTGKMAIAEVLTHIAGTKHAQLEAIVNKAYQAVNTVDPVQQAKLMGEWATELATGDPAIDAQARTALFDLVTTLKDSATSFASNLKSRAEWWSPEIRYGTHLLRSKDVNGRQVSVDGYSTQAELAEYTRRAKLKGATQFDSKERISHHSFDLGDDMKAAVAQLDNTLGRKLRDALPASMQAQADSIMEYLNLGGEIDRLNQAHLANPSLPTRRLAEGRENLNMVTGWEHYINTMGRALSVSQAKARMRFEKSNPELKTGEYANIVQQVEDTFSNYLAGDTEFAKKLTQINAVFHLGANIPTHLAELSQGLSTVMPEIAFQTGSMFKAAKMLLGVSREMAQFYGKKSLGKAMGKDEWIKWGQPNEQAMLETLAQRGVLNQHAFHDDFTSDTTSNIMVKSAGQKTMLQQGASALTAPFKAYADTTMNVYESFTRFNARLSALIGYRLARAEGKTHVESIEAADRFLTKTTFAGGRASRPPEFYKNSNVGAIMYALQRYSLSWMTMYARHLRGSFGDQVKMDQLGQGSKLNHKKALATMSIVQFGLAGALGLPFAGAMMAVLEKTFDMDIRGRVYALLGELLDEDSKEGGFLADMVMRGMANTLAERVGAPIDLGSRFSIMGLPGMNEYNGFDPGRVFGPTANVANSVFKGMTGVVTGDLNSLSKGVMPVGMRKAVEYYVNGDALTSKGSKLGLDDKEGFLYSLGFTPGRVRKLRDAELILDNQHNERLVKTSRATDKIAQLLDSDPVSANQRFTELVREGMDERVLSRELNARRRALARQVADAKLRQTYPKDIRRSISAPDQKRAVQTLSNLNVELPSPNFGQEHQDYNQVLTSLGLSPMRNRTFAQAQDFASAW